MPPDALSDLAHALETSAAAAMSAAKGPEQLQITPILIGAPCADALFADEGPDMASWTTTTASSIATAPKNRPNLIMTLETPLSTTTRCPAEAGSTWILSAWCH